MCIIPMSRVANTREWASIKHIHHAMTFLLSYMVAIYGQDKDRVIKLSSYNKPGQTAVEAVSLGNLPILW